MNYTLVTLQRGNTASFTLNNVSYALTEDQVIQLIACGVLRVASSSTPFFCYNCHRTTYTLNKPHVCPYCQAEEWNQSILLYCNSCCALFEQNSSDGISICPHCKKAIEWISDFRRIIYDITGVDDPEVVKSLTPRLAQIQRDMNSYDAFDHMVNLIRQAMVEINARAMDKAVAELTGAKKPKEEIEDPVVRKQKSEQAFIELMRRKKAKQFGVQTPPVKQEKVEERTHPATEQSGRGEVKGIMPEADRENRPQNYPSHWDNKKKPDDK